jgi:hypothetical protein
VIQEDSLSLIILVLDNTHHTILEVSLLQSIEVLRVVPQERHLGSLLLPLLQPLSHKYRRGDRGARLPLLVRGLDLRVVDIVNLNIIKIMTLHLVLIML